MALVLCAASVSMIVLSVGDGAPWLVLVIPAPIWGPALALATYAYHRRRTGSARLDPSGRDELRTGRAPVPTRGRGRR